MGSGTVAPREEESPPPITLTLNKIYEQKQLIGSGTFGKVYLCLNKLNGLEYALKVVEITAKNKDEAVRQIESLKSEIRVLKKLNHPNIVKYYSFDISQDNKEVEIVLEYAQKGSLKTYIIEHGALSETEAILKIGQILEGLQYLHQQNIVHRDLKCANILMMKDGTLKITDFGTAKHIKLSSNQDIGNVCPSLKGTPYYMAPEILRRTGHNVSADIWSLGCLVIEMLSGKAPWTSITNNFEEIITYIVNGIHPPYPKGLTDDCECFLSLCLNNIASQRPNCHQLLNHRWITSQSLKNNSHQKYSLAKTNDKEQKTYQHKIDSQAGKKAEKISQIERYIVKKTRQRDRNKVGQRESARPKKQKTPILLHSDEKLLISEDIEVIDYYQPLNRVLFPQNGTNQSSMKANKTVPQMKTPETLISQVKEVQQVEFERVSSKGELGNRPKVSQIKGQVIDTLISRQERARYLQRSRILKEQREEQKQKWERELKEGGNYLRKQINSRYNL